jgi:tetratricopeptide (TPR) repeat protein
MSTKVSDSIVRLAIVAVICVAQFAAPHAQSTADSPRPPSRRLSRSEHLQEWLQAVERHEPGRDDESLSVFDSWRPDDFEYLAIDLNTLLSLMADPTIRTFYWSASGRSRQVVYSGSDLRLILSLARDASERRGEDSVGLERRRARNRNHILKRGAIFHTDIAIESIIGVRQRGRQAPSRFQEFMLQMPDGRAQGLAVDVGHWEFARSLLDKVVPAAARDEFVRRWYTTIAALEQGFGQLSPPHVTHGLRLFPDDAGFLFQAACLHEALAEPRVQEALQNAAVPNDVKFDISSRRAELREAENLFRKALKVQPDHLEARIRLGRVLGLRGEHAEAEGLLRKAAADAMEPLLQYYAQLFLGAERETLGDRAQARDLYGRASQLYPDAQSPRLALSLLSARDGNHKEALAAMKTVLALPGDARMDPWWSYYRAQGRKAADDLTELYISFLDEDRR